MHANPAPGPSRERQRILCVGALTHDTVFRMPHLPGGAGKFLPLDMIDVMSGMAANAATAIARLGGDVALWASVGDDDTGKNLVAAMQAEAIDCSLVRQVANARSAAAVVLVDPQGERMIVPYYAPALLRDPIAPAGISRGEFRAVMTDVRWPDAAAQALDAARHAGIYGVLDADVAAREILDLLAPLASHIVASRAGAALLTGQPDAAAAAASLAATFASEIVVTAGEQGCYWVDRAAGELRYIAAPHVGVVDTTAAGDVFHGAYTCGLVEGKSGNELLRFASAAAALKCTRFGGRLGAPNRAETETFLRRTWP